MHMCMLYLTFYLENISNIEEFQEEHLKNSFLRIKYCYLSPSSSSFALFVYMHNTFSIPFEGQLHK